MRPTASLPSAGCKCNSLATCTSCMSMHRIRLRTAQVHFFYYNSFFPFPCHLSSGAFVFCACHPEISLYLLRHLPKMALPFSNELKISMRQDLTKTGEEGTRTDSGYHYSRDMSAASQPSSPGGQAHVTYVSKPFSNLFDPEQHFPATAHEEYPDDPEASEYRSCSRSRSSFRGLRHRRHRSRSRSRSIFRGLKHRRHRSLSSSRSRSRNRFRPGADTRRPADAGAKSSLQPLLERLAALESLVKIQKSKTSALETQINESNQAAH
jgi:hypothetical protein